MISYHNTTIDQVGPFSYGGVQPSSFNGKVTSIDGDKLTSCEPHINPYVCMVCGQDRYGHGPKCGTPTMIAVHVGILLKL